MNGYPPWGIVWIVCFIIGALCTFSFSYGVSVSKKSDEEEEGVDRIVSNDWDAICQAAIDKARDGDSSARAWVTQHIFKKQIEEEEIEDVKTDQSIIDEAIKTLVKAMGYKRGEAKDLVLKIVSEKDFDTLDSLITHILKG